MAFDTGPRRTTAVALTADRRSMTRRATPFSATDPRSGGGLDGLVHHLRAERQTPAARRDQPLHAIALNAHVEVRQERRFGVLLGTTCRAFEDAQIRTWRCEPSRREERHLSDAHEGLEPHVRGRVASDAVHDRSATRGPALRSRRLGRFPTRYSRL
jgi:hypothetical protein